MSKALSEGKRILGDRYIVLRLLYTRPRVKLYLGWRLSRNGQDGGLVAIRELILSGLPAEIRAQVEQAAWEELLSPGVVGALSLPGARATEHTWLGAEHERHYLVMRLFEGMAGCSIVLPLADLLHHRHWPRWLNMSVAVAWTLQLARVVARLHRLGTLLLDLDPSTILIDENGKATWSPLLLPTWPPSPSFWPEGEKGNEYFPASLPQESAFVAPELSSGVYDERADVYALGAILYLLLTGYAPVSAPLRLLHAQQHVDGLELISPRFFCPTLPLVLEEIVSCALSLEPEERFPSAFALVEALEELQASQVFGQAMTLRQPKR